MDVEFGSWASHFPQVMHFIDIYNEHPKPYTLLQTHPDYDAAKYREDRNAALRLITHFLDNPKNRAQLQSLKQNYPDAILTSVHAIESVGKNYIPQILAGYIGEHTGLEVDNTIIQTNTVHRSGSDEWHRFAFRPTFSGEVQRNRTYIMVDDIFSLGGSFNELRLFIEKHGGCVIQAVAMATGKSGPEIAVNHNTLKNLIDKYSPEALSLFLKEIGLYGGNYKALTEPEARALRRAPSLDQARNRIFEARQKGLLRVDQESAQFHKTSQTISRSHRR